MQFAGFQSTEAKGNGQLHAKLLAHIVAATQAYRDDFLILKSVLACAAIGGSARPITGHLLPAPSPSSMRMGVCLLPRGGPPGGIPIQWRHKCLTGRRRILRGPPTAGRSSSCPGASRRGARGDARARAAFARALGLGRRDECVQRQTLGGRQWLSDRHAAVAVPTRPGQCARLASLAR